MATEGLIIFVNSSNSWSGTEYQLPDPSSYSIDWEDLDLDSYRSVINGDLNRNVLNRRWAKIGLSWRFLPGSDVQQVLSRVNTSSLWVKVKSPAFGSSNYIIFKAYVSKMHVEAIEGITFRPGNDHENGFNVSFNIVQERNNPAWQ